MPKLNNNGNLKLAIQKEGRLTSGTIELLRNAGFEFETYRQRLYSSCQNFPLEILFARDDDIPAYVASGTIDLGIIGQNLLYEKLPKVDKLLNLRFGFCSLVVAVLKESAITEIQDLTGKTVASTYPVSTKKFFEQKNIPVKVLRFSGSVEIAPILGISQAIADLTATGSTLASNDLRILAKIYASEAVLIANKACMSPVKKQVLLDKLIIKLQAVLSAKN